MQEIIQECPACGGTGREAGVVPGPGGPEPYDNPCGKCSGTGSLPLGRLSDDLIDLFDDIKDKIDDIKEKVDEIKEKVDEL